MSRVIAIPVLVLAALLYAVPASAQVNIEVFNDHAREEGWSGTLGGGLELFGGNIQILGVNGHVSAQYQHVEDAPKELGRKRVVHRVMGIYRGNFRRFGGFGPDNTIIHAHMGHVRYTYMHTSLWGVEGFTQYQFDQFLRLGTRALLGANVRIEPIRKERVYLSMGSGYMAEQEFFNDNGPTVEPRFNNRWSNFVCISIDLIKDRLKLTHTTYYQPNFTALLSDRHELHESQLALTIAKGLTLNLTSLVRRDSTPPPPVVPLDYQFRQTLNYTF